MNKTVAPSFDAVLTRVNTTITPEDMHHLRTLMLELCRAGEEAQSRAVAAAIRVLNDKVSS